jgi:hypothetical protein
MLGPVTLPPKAWNTRVAEFVTSDEMRLRLITSCLLASAFGLAASSLLVTGDALHVPRRIPRDPSARFLADCPRGFRVYAHCGRRGSAPGFSRSCSSYDPRSHTADSRICGLEHSTPSLGGVTRAQSSRHSDMDCSRRGPCQLSGDCAATVCSQRGRMV